MVKSVLKLEKGLPDLNPVYISRMIKIENMFKEE